MMNIRLIATDIDGTILPFGAGDVSPATKEAVRLCERKGVPFVIASGRWYVAAKRIVDALDIRDGYLVVADGGAVMTTGGSVLREWRMRPEQARRIHRISLHYDMMRIAFTPQGLYRVGGEVMGRELIPFRQYPGGFEEINGDETAFLQRGLDAPYKLDFYSPDKTALKALRSELEAEGFTVVSSWPTNIEVMMPDTGKGHAVRWLAESLGIAPENVMVFGDHTNDLNLFRCAGWPVAVGNAVDALKDAARLVCESCDQDGVARTIQSVLGGSLL